MINQPPAWLCPGPDLEQQRHVAAFPGLMRRRGPCKADSEAPPWRSPAATARPGRVRSFCRPESESAGATYTSERDDSDIPGPRSRTRTPIPARVRVGTAQASCRPGNVGPGPGSGPVPTCAATRQPVRAAGEAGK
jgi:hypothetical protein